MLIIEQVDSADFYRLERLVETTFVETWTGLVDDSHLREHLMDGHALKVVNRFCRDTKSDVLVVRDGDELVGYAIGFLPEDMNLPRLYKIEKLYLRASVQRRGIGSMLWNRMMDLALASGAEGVTLTHYPPNVRASRFYERIGLKKVDETVYQCGDGEYHDWVLAANWDDLQLASGTKGVMAD